MVIGIVPEELAARFHHRHGGMQSIMSELIALGLLERHARGVRLTARGRLLSNEVFARLISNASGTRAAS
jgi:coproporphyrinogen III oxidase-like Fe-S oxidoreductase